MRLLFPLLTRVPPEAYKYPGNPVRRSWQGNLPRIAGFQTVESARALTPDAVPKPTLQVGRRQAIEVPDVGRSEACTRQRSDRSGIPRCEFRCHGILTDQCRLSSTLRIFRLD